MEENYDKNFNRLSRNSRPAVRALRIKHNEIGFLAGHEIAYKVLQLQHQNLPAARALYLATLGAAEALRLEDRIGNLVPGKEADFIVLDPQGTDISARRLADTHSPDELLFALTMLADDRNIAATFVNGKRVHITRS